MSSTINNMFYKEGYDLTFQNAKNLLEISVIAAERHLFGLACSLNILSAEEGLKAFFIITKHYNPTQKINKFEDVFKHHKVKHEELKKILNIHEKIKHETSIFLKTLEPLLNELESKPREFIDANKEKYDSINDDIKFHKRQIEITFDSENIFKWLSTANNDKNKGLYVDIESNKWSSPISMTQEKYTKERKYTEDILVYVKNTEELYKKREKLANCS